MKKFIFTVICAFFASVFTFANQVVDTNKVYNLDTISVVSFYRYFSFVDDIYTFLQL